MSDGTIRRRIGDIPDNIEKIVSSKIKDSHIGICITMDESTDIGGKTQLLAFVRISKNDKNNGTIFMLQRIRTNHDR